MLLALARSAAVAAGHGLAVLFALALTCLLHCPLHALALLLIGPGLCLGILHLWWRRLSIAAALAGLRARRVLVVTGLGLPLLARLRLALARILLALLRLLALRILLPLAVLRWLLLPVLRWFLLIPPLPPDCLRLRAASTTARLATASAMPGCSASARS